MTGASIYLKQKYGTYSEYGFTHRDDIVNDF